MIHGLPVLKYLQTVYKYFVVTISVTPEYLEATEILLHLFIFNRGRGGFFKKYSPFQRVWWCSPRFLVIKLFDIIYWTKYKVTKDDELSLILENIGELLLLHLFPIFHLCYRKLSILLTLTTEIIYFNICIKNGPN